jgi:hypothetical protein
VSSPTQRALAECRKRGWTAQVVERWVPQARRRVDLFGCIDVVAITDEGILGIQVTSGSNHAARRTKALELDSIREWMRHAAFAVWSYSRRVAYRQNGSKAKRKAWVLREEVLG